MDERQVWHSEGLRELGRRSVHSQVQFLRHRRGLQGDQFGLAQQRLISLLPEPDQSAELHGVCWPDRRSAADRRSPASRFVHFDQQPVAGFPRQRQRPTVLRRLRRRIHGRPSVAVCHQHQRQSDTHDDIAFRRRLHLEAGQWLQHADIDDGHRGAGQRVELRDRGHRLRRGFDDDPRLPARGADRLSRWIRWRRRHQHDGDFRLG